MLPTLIRSLAKPLLLFSALLGMLSWLLPNHYHPWHAFAQEYCAFGALLVLCCAVLLRPWTKERAFPAGVFLLALLALVPVLQGLTGVVSFMGDAWMASLYLLGFAAAYGLGFICASENLERFTSGLATVLLAAALISVGLALCQWLQVEGLDIYMVDLAPGRRPFANLAQPNHLATLLCLGLASVMYLHLRKRLSGGTALFLALLLIVGLTMTQSRTAWLGAVLVAGWWLWKRQVLPDLGGRVLLLGLAFFAALTYSWPTITAALDLPGLNEHRPALDHARPILWRQFLDAIWQAPWLGYGWNEVSEAQIAVAPRHPAVAMSAYSHNLLLDLLLWNGIPLGMMLIGALAFWSITRAKRCKTIEGWFALLAIGFVGLHSMLEYPFAYGYFLVTIGLAAGLVDADQGEALTFGGRPARAALWTGATVGALAMGVIWHEYRLVEDDYRLLRFETARIGKVRAAQPAPDLVVLSQLRELIRFARTPAVPGMDDAELLWMEKAAHRYPYPPSLMRYALALALNGRLEPAALELQRLRKLHGEGHYAEALHSISMLAADHPALAELARQGLHKEDIAGSRPL